MDKSLRVQVLFGMVDKLLAPMKRIAGGAKGLSRDLQATQDKLKGLQRQSADVSAFRALKGEVKSTGVQLRDAQRRAGEIARANKAVEQPTRAMTSALRKAREEVRALKAQQEGQISKLQQVRGRMREAGAAAGDLASYERKLRDDIKGVNSELDVQRRRLGEVGEQSRRMDRARAAQARTQQVSANMAVTGAASVGAGAAIGAPLVASTRGAASAESRITDIGQRSNASRGERAKLLKDLQAQAPKVNQELDRLIDGMDTLTGLGASIPAGQAMIPSIGKAATAYKAEVSDIAAASYAAFSNLKTAAGENGKVLDIMAVGGKRGAVEMRDLAAAFPAMSANAAAMGETGVKAVARLTAAAQIARKGTGDAATATNNLNNLLLKMSGNEEVTKNFREMGVDLERELKAAVKRGEDPLQRLAELTMKATKGDSGQIGRLVGDQQAQSALKMLVQNLPEYKSIRDEALAAQGTVDTDFADRMGDAAEQGRALKGSLDAVGQTIGANLLPQATAFMAQAKPIVDRMSAWAKANPEVVGTMAKVAAVLAIGLVVMGGLAIAVAAVLGPFALMNLAFVQSLPVLMGVGKGFGFLAKAGPGLWRMFQFGGRLVSGFGRLLGGFASRALPLLGRGLLIAGRAMGGFALAVARAGLVLLANPMTWIILAIVAAVVLLAGVAYLIYKNWGTISAWFGAMWARVVGAFNNAKAAVVDVVQNLWARVKALFSGGIVAVVGRLLSFSPLGILLRALSPLLPYVQSVWARIRTFFSAGVAALAGVLAAFRPSAILRNVVAPALAFLASLPGRFAGFGRDMIQGMINGVTGMLGSLKQTITGAASSAADWFRSKLGIRSPSRVFMAIGGHVMGGLERGLQRNRAGPLAVMDRVADSLSAWPGRLAGAAGVLAITTAVSAGPAPAAMPALEPVRLTYAAPPALLPLPVPEPIALTFAAPPPPPVLEPVRLSYAPPPALPPLPVPEPIRLSFAPLPAMPPLLALALTAAVQTRTMPAAPPAVAELAPIPLAAPAPLPAAPAGRASGGAPTGQASAGGDTYEVHFHPAPGMNERELFRLWERWFESKQHAAAARRRSAFGDVDGD